MSYDYIAHLEWRHKIETTESEFYDLMKDYISLEDLRQFIGQYSVYDYVLFLSHLPFSIDVPITKNNITMAVAVLDAIQSFILSQNNDPEIKSRIANAMQKFMHFKNTNPTYQILFNDTEISKYEENSDNKFIEEVYYPSGFMKERIIWDNDRVKNRKIWNEDGTLVEEIHFDYGFIPKELHLYFYDAGSISRRETFWEYKLRYLDEWYPNGIHLSRINTQPTADGMTFERYWYDNGKEREIIHRKNGLLHESYGEFYENGRLKKTGHYKMGRKHGRWTYSYSNGVEKSLGYYENGKKQGVWDHRSDNGQLTSTGSYINGEKEGEWQFWTPNGKRLPKKYYSHGTKIRTEKSWYNLLKYV